MNTVNKIEIQLPFSGFYYSIHDSYIDNHIECELDYLESELGYTDEQLDLDGDEFDQWLDDNFDDFWNEYCQDNALIYNDEHACLQF